MLANVSGDDMVLGYLACPFDLLNVGDLDLIAQARSRCDYLVVGVYSDELIESISGRPPVVPLQERLVLVGHIRGVDHATRHDGADSVSDEFHALFSTNDGASQSDRARSIVLEPSRRTQCPLIVTALAPVAQLGVA